MSKLNTLISKAYGESTVKERALFQAPADIERRAMLLLEEQVNKKNLVEQCSSCKGKGHCDCLNCGGSGEMTCLVCGCDKCECDTEDGNICPECSGSGESVCPTCHGSKIHIKKEAEKELIDKRGE